MASVNADGWNGFTVHTPWQSKNNPYNSYIGDTTRSPCLAATQAQHTAGHVARGVYPVTWASAGKQLARSATGVTSTLAVAVLLLCCSVLFCSSTPGDQRSFRGYWKGNTQRRPAGCVSAQGWMRG